MMVSVEFLSQGSKLRGYSFPSKGTPVLATVLFLQGFPGVEGDELICERLSEENIHVFTFNYRGTFRSEGLFSFSNALSDIQAAYQFLQESSGLKEYQVDPGQIVLGGWSFGSGLAPAAAVRLPGLARLFAISGRDFDKEAIHIQEDPEYARQVRQNLQSIRAPDGPVAFNDDILSDLIAIQETFDMEKLARALKEHSVLLVGGWNDSVIGIEEHLLPFYRILAANGAKKVRIAALPDDHEFSSSRDQLVRLIVDWLRESG
jgi:dienelactone hydrolase